MKGWEAKKITFIVGPTAAGKTETAHRAAQKTKAEIISCDSVAVYRGMDIISNKPSAAMRRQVSYHMLDIASPEEEYNVAKFVTRARGAIEEISARRRPIIITGGSGLYIDSLLFGLFPQANNDPRIRKSLEELAKDKGRDFIYKRLESLDPAAAKKIHPHNLRRIIRALEACLVSGERFSRLGRRRKGLLDEGGLDIAIFGISLPRERLYQRINSRAEKMFKQGLVEEVSRLIKGGLSKTAAQALGIKEISGYLRKDYSLERAKYLLKRNTRHFARRQLTWFRRNKLIHWKDGLK